MEDVQSESNRVYCFSSIRQNLFKQRIQPSSPNWYLTEVGTKCPKCLNCEMSNSTSIEYIHCNLNQPFCIVSI